MRLLQSGLGVSLIDPAGGADDILIEGGALSPSVSTITDTAYKIENICNPRNDSIEIYKVRSGDTISGIAKMFCVSENTIRWANGINKTLRVGQELTILPISGVMHDVEKGDTIAKIARTYKGDVDAILAYNNLSRDDVLGTEMSIIIPNGKKPAVKRAPSRVSSPSRFVSAPAASGYYSRPAYGKITSGFGMRRDPITGARRYHKGVDISGSRGSAIFAAAEGTVVIEARHFGWNGGYGKKVVIMHGNGTKTLYAHMNSVSVKVGDLVKQGQVIGTMGKTGRVTGVHLHFEVIKNNTNLKPVF